jgi:hypothetical protein
MRGLTKELGRLVYKVDTEPLPVSNVRRGGANGGTRRAGQSAPPGSLDQNSSVPQRVRTLSSDEDADPPEQITPQQQQQPVRTSNIERSRVARRRTNSDDSLTHSSAPPSIINRVNNFNDVYREKTLLFCSLIF